ncbi:unnamed protein product [Didymodactylos carnosus]|uniref:Uncharacterized protein n=2 Tax=Didymodactylos carnosus TaxID=1234261 RepID=A0A814Q5D2_9BILA|nr:unnamed protein product [Didymodactylos carnosus]CAF3878840.1 unnamed protein product [Didymodactylos carnosus]
MSCSKLSSTLSNIGTNYQDFLRKFTDENFMDNLLKEFDEILTKLNVIDQFLFSKYDQFVKDIKDFRESLLKFVLESKVHLSVLKDNFKKQRYQNATDDIKLKFIKERLDKINRQTLFDYINGCQKLITTSLDLHTEYGTRIFKIKYFVLNILGFTAMGALAGFSIGLVLPFLTAFEMGVGAAVGALAGLAYVIYQFACEWDKKMKSIEIVRNHLIEIHDMLENLKQTLHGAYYRLGIAQTELDEQQEGKSFQDVADLEDYVLTSYNEFIKLENVLLNMRDPVQ